jgi:hypothetical protein
MSFIPDTPLFFPLLNMSEQENEEDQVKSS